MVPEGWKVLGREWRRYERVRKELCHRMAETLVDMEEAARGWWHNVL
jgi:hypothetical protein